MMDRQSFDDGMVRLKGLFIRKLYDRHDRLELLAQALADGLDPAETVAQVEAISHKIAGAAGSVGLQPLGEAASQLECLIRDQRAVGIYDVPAIAATLDAFLDLSLDICTEAEQAGQPAASAWAAAS